MADDLARLAQVVDDLEGRVDGPLDLDAVQRALGNAGLVQTALAEELLLVDYRERLDATTGVVTPVTLCRLNRRHPLAAALADGDGEVSG